MQIHCNIIKLFLARLNLKVCLLWNLFKYSFLSLRDILHHCLSSQETLYGGQIQKLRLAE